MLFDACASFSKYNPIESAPDKAAAYIIIWVSGVMWPELQSSANYWLHNQNGNGLKVQTPRKIREIDIYSPPVLKADL